LRRTSFRWFILPHRTDTRGKLADGRGVASAELLWTGQETRVSQRVTMYTTPWCGFCKRLKSQLAREGIEVAEVDIEQDPAAADYVMSVNGGMQTVPTVVFPDGAAMTNPSAAQVRERLAALAIGT
jgi:mycoredoxin